MAALVANSAASKGGSTLATNTLTASDTYVYVPGDILLLHNVTAGSLTLTFTGEGPQITPDGLGIVGAASFATSAIAAGLARVLFADTRTLFLQGNVTITGGLGMIVTIARR